MRFLKKLSIWVVIMSLVLGLGFSTIPPGKAQFVVASPHYWDYPDEYGQGIEYIYFIISDAEGDPYNWTYQFWNGTERDASGNPAGLDVPHGGSISMRVHVWVNGTFTGYSYADGRDLYTKVGIEIYYVGELLFSQENISQAGGSSAKDPMWAYDYEIVLNGDPLYLGPDYQAGQSYTIVVNYEVFY